METDLLTGKEVATILRVSPSTVTALRKCGEIPFVQIGRRIFYRQVSVAEFVEKNEVTKVSV